MYSEKRDFIDVQVAYTDRNDGSGSSDWVVNVRDGVVDMPEGMTAAEAIILIVYINSFNSGSLIYVDPECGSLTAKTLRKWAPSIITFEEPPEATSVCVSLGSGVDFDKRAVFSFMKRKG